MNLPGKSVLRRHIRFALVNGRFPRPDSFCVKCEKRSGRATCANLARNSPTAIRIAIPTTARVRCWLSQLTREHREYPRAMALAANMPDLSPESSDCRRCSQAGMNPFVAC